MTEVEFDLETARILSETRTIVEETKTAARLAIAQVEAALDMVIAEHKMLISVVRAAGDAQTIRDMDNLLKALATRFARPQGESTTLQ